MTTSSYRLIVLLILMTSVFICGLARAQDPVYTKALAGVYDANGDIELMTDYFRRFFPSGQPVVEVKILEIDGYMYLSRKGYSELGDCHNELVPLVDSDHQPLPAGIVPEPGSPAYVSIEFPTLYMACLDDGCRSLEGITPPPNQPPVREAYCDRTRLSDNQCRCHVERGMGTEVVRQDRFCKTQMTESETDLDAMFRVITAVHSIEQ